MNVKKDAAAKGFTISAQMLQFILGLFITIIILFALLFYFFRNAYERVAEQQTANLYNKIKEVCDTGEPQTMDFSLPQQIAFQDWLKKKIGFQSPVTSNVLLNPYFYVYFEKFPPDPPYQLGGGTLGIETAPSLIAPWSEDLPWSSNLLLTAALDLTAFNHVPGFEKLKDGLTDAKTAIIDSERLRPLVKAGQVLNDGQKIILGNKKVLVGALVGGTIFCKLVTDNSIETCAAYSAVGYFTARIAAKVVQVGAGELKDFISESKVGFKVKALEDFADKLETRGQDLTVQSLEQPIEYNGKQIQFIDHIDSQGRGVVTKGDHWDSLEAYWMQEGKPEKIGGYTFEKDTTTGQLKDILLEKSGLEGPWTKLKNSLNSLKGSLGEMLGSDVLSPNGMDVAANSMEVSVKQNPDSWSDIIKAARKQLPDLQVNPNDKKEVEDFVLKAASDLRDKSQSGYITLIEKDSNIQKILSTTSDPETFSKKLLDYFKSDAAKDPQEAKRLINWMSGKELRIGEQMKSLGQGTLGYTFLRYQDLYTPLGVSYWDKTLGSYENPLTACGSNQLCLKYGVYIRKYDLPTDCDVKLSRNSIVAQDPRFYLVSPCFSKLEITKKGSTVYVDPHICSNPPADYADNPNYCYATSGYVNYYVGSETSSFFADCIGTGICAIVQGVGTAGAAAPVSFADIAAKCLGVKTPTGPCGYLGASLRLLIDLHRESMASYPYVPDYIMNSFGVDSNRYVGC